MADISTTAVDIAGAIAPTPGGSTLNPHELTVPGGAPAAPEAPETAIAEVPAPSAPVDDKAAAKFAALSRKERQLRQQEKSLKQLQADMDRQKSEFESWRKEKEEFETTWKQNPYEAMKKRGVDYKELTEKYVLDSEATPEQKTAEYIKKLEQKLESFESRLKEKDELSAKEKQELDAQKAREQESTYLNNLTSFVNENKDKYEFIVRNDAVQLIYDVQKAYYNQTLEDEGEGKILNREQAADKVEEYLFEQAKNLLETTKLKSLIGEKPVPKPTPKSATLSSTIAQSVPTTPDKPLSDEESKRRMAAMIKWQE